MSVRSRRNAVREMKVVPHLKVRGVLTQAKVKSTSEEKYHVILSKRPAEMKDSFVAYWQYSSTCYHIVGNSLKNCPGNSHSERRRDTVCKHCMSVLEARLNAKNWKLAICDDTKEGKRVVRTAFQNAVNLSNFGGKIIKLISNQGEGVVWAVATPPKKKEH